MDGDYSYYIGAFSILITIVASYEALNITDKMSHAYGRIRPLLFMICAILMGSSIWFIYFIGEAIFQLGTPSAYNIKIALSFIIISIMTSFISFYIMTRKTITPIKIVLSSFIMSIGILSMHYRGIQEMIIATQLDHGRFYLWASMMLTFIATFAALSLFHMSQSHPRKKLLHWISALIMTLGIGSTPFIGLATTERNIGFINLNSINPVLLFSLIIIIIFIIIGSWSSMYFNLHILKEIAYKDAITRLPNRNELNRYFEMYSNKTSIAVLFLDLDRFKTVNDTFGHDIGDLLIKEVGSRLQAFIEKNQCIFRIGGDEFVITVKNGKKDSAKHLAKNILNSIKKTYYIDGIELCITGSIGISVGFIQDSQYSTMLKEADSAMYKAKSLGKNQYYLYDQDIGNDEVKVMELKRDLQKAFELNQLNIIYKPKWDNKTNGLYGFDVLVYWKHPKYGQIPSSTFITVAEEVDFILPMTKWVLTEACRQCKSWQAQGVLQPVTIEISIHLFQDGHLPDLIESIVNETTVEPNMLDLKITESKVRYDLNDIINQLQSIRALGVRISLAESSSKNTVEDLLINEPNNS